MTLVIYTDGASKANGKRHNVGGWGVIVYSDFLAFNYELCGGEKDTTNNRMEMEGMYRALKFVYGLKEDASLVQVIIFTDSEYVKRGLTEWRSGWVQRGYRTTSGKVLRNKEKWKKLFVAHDKVKEIVEINIRWVKGHSKNEGNEKADLLANEGCAMAKKL